MLDQDGDTIMLGVKPFTIISGGALRVDLEPEKLARHYGLEVEVLIPPCHSRSKTLPPLMHSQLAEAIPATNQALYRLNKRLQSPISLQYIHCNYHIVKQAEMVLTFTMFEPERSTCFGVSGWAVEFAKLLQRTLYVYDLERNIWFWYDHSEEVFRMCDQISEDQIAVPTLMPRTAIVGVGNIYEFPNGLQELQNIFKRSLLLPEASSNPEPELVARLFTLNI